MWKFIALGIVFAVSGNAAASLETTVKCGEHICVSITKHRLEELKDYYFYGNESAVRQTFFRFQGGSSVSFIFKNLQDVTQCKGSHVQALGKSSNRAWGSGCIVARDNSTGLSFSYVVEANGARVSQFLHRVDPVIWLYGYNADGDFLPVVSPIVDLRSATVEQPIHRPGP